MNKKWVRYLCDPVDKTDIILDSVSESKDGEIISGILKSRSGIRYRATDGVPVILTPKTQKISTVESFEREWNKFDFDFGKEGWLEGVVKPSVGSLKYFKNKVIVDLGSGSGRQSLWMAQAGAKFVFSVELSDSARSVVRKVTSQLRNKIFVIQADLAHLPINTKKVEIDLFYCINVIQHTKDPTRALKTISELMNKDSRLLFNIYLKRGRFLSLKMIELMRVFTKFLPPVVLEYFSFLIALAVFPLHHLGQSFKETWLDLYDLLGSHAYQKFYSEDDLKQMLKAANLKITKRSRYTMLLARG